jgi:acyl-coenzyme A thioesterase 13
MASDAATEAGNDLGGYGAPVFLRDGPFAGWQTWGAGQDPYETHTGPFCFKHEADGGIRVAFQPQPHHLNGAQALHGGALMSFADFALFAIASKELENTMAVTVTFSSEFVGAGGLDGWIEAEGRVIKATRSLVFVQAVLVQRQRPLLAFSGTLKKLNGRAS